jgi:hypothetical protein
MVGMADHRGVWKMVLLPPASYKKLKGLDKVSSLL